jgi:hypothetical protein
MKVYCNGRFGQSSGKDAALPTGNDTALKDFVSCKPVFVLKKQVFWIVAPCGWVSDSRNFEGAYRLHLHGYESI